MKPTLWTKDPDTASAAVCRLCPEIVKNTIARADEIQHRIFLFQDHWEMEATNTPVQFSDPVPWDAIPSGDPEWTYALNRHTIFLNLAKAWRYTRNDSYLETFVELFSDWADRVPHTPESEATTWRALEAGLRPENWLRTAELFGDALSPELLEKMNVRLREHGEYLAREYKAFHRLSNWGAIQAHGLFLLGLWFARRDWQQLALERLAENLHHAILPDGVQWEQSPMYHCEVLHAAADTLVLAQRNGLSVPDGLADTVHRMFHALAVWVTPSREILPQSDSDRIDAGDLLACGALFFSDPELAAAAQGTICEETLWDFGADAPEQLASLPAERPVFPSQALASSGNYLLRSGWSTHDTYIHFHSGSLGGGHGHADLLHLDVWHNGEAVLVDSGRFTYVDGSERAAFKSPAAHNTFRVDGTDFTHYRGTWEWTSVARPLPTEVRFTQTADYLSAGHLGYAAQGILAEREVLFLKPDILIGIDRITAPSGTHHTVEQFFHFGPGDLQQTGDSVFWQGDHTCAQLHWLTGEKTILSNAAFSPQYNLKKSVPALCLQSKTESTASLPFVLCLGGCCTVQLLPVTDGCGHPLPAESVQSICITRNGQSTTVILCHQTGSHDAALLCAGGYTGHGQILIFTPQDPAGSCLK